MGYTGALSRLAGTFHYTSRPVMPTTFTGAIGALFMLPLRAIIAACVQLRIHPNLLTLAGVLINVWAAGELALNHFFTAGLLMLLANMFDFIDGKVASESGTISKFGGVWDSVVDRFPDITLF